MTIIFETERLSIRRLQPSDLEAFHEMQGNLNVMRYTTGRAMTLAENRKELERLIDRYDEPGNDFWVWAVVRKSDLTFVGTCALVRNNKDEREIGYRFLEKYWGRGFGKEITRGLINYGLQQPGITALVAYVNKDNIPSVRILDATFPFIEEFYNEEEGCVDRYYRIAGP